MLLTLFGKECRQTAKSLIFYLILLILVFFYTSQMGALELFQKPEQGETDSYGMRPSDDPQAIMEATLGMLVTDYEANRYTAYPMGFYKEVILTEEKQEKIHRILTECTGMDSGYEDFVTPPETQQVGDGSFMVVPGSSATVPVADTLTYDRFLELMGQVDELLGGGSSYDPETVNQNAMESMTYEEALEAYEASLTQDKVTRGYARLFCDYMGLMLGLLPVFPAVVRVLRDKRASASQVIYVRSASSASIVLSRWLASICMLLLPVLLLGIMPAWQSVYYGKCAGSIPGSAGLCKIHVGLAAAGNSCGNCSGIFCDRTDGRTAGYSDSGILVAGQPVFQYKFPGGRCGLESDAPIQFQPGYCRLAGGISTDGEKPSVLYRSCADVGSSYRLGLSSEKERGAAKWQKIFGPQERYTLNTITGFICWQRRFSAWQPRFWWEWRR